MKKSDMITTINDSFNRLWKELEEYEKIFGSDSVITNMKRSEWCAMYDLKRALGMIE